MVLAFQVQHDLFNEQHLNSGVCSLKHPIVLLAAKLILNGVVLIRLASHQLIL